MKKTLSVAAIEEGTVIDHISHGGALKILRLLQLDKNRMTLGLNLPSKSLGVKDIIKVEKRILSEEEASQIAIFSPFATINVIQNFQILKKYKVKLPLKIEKAFSCPHASCITQSEPVSPFFYVRSGGDKIELECKYCQKRFVY